MKRNLKFGLIILAAIVIIFLGCCVALHFAQKSHDHLDFSLEETYPEAEPFVPGEVFATMLAECMRNELNAPFGWRPNDFFLS